MAIVFAMYRPIISLSLLPVAITAQYGASCFYHWLPYNKARQTIDHLMIAVLITATYVQYWLRSLPPTEASWRIWTLGAVTVIVLLVRLALPKYGKLRGILYLALGLGGLIMSLMSTDMLPTAAWIGFLSGIGLYFVQFVVFALQKPDPLPEILGHRELQHAILLLASGLHLFVAAIYL